MIKRDAGNEEYTTAALAVKHKQNSPYFQHFKPTFLQSYVSSALVCGYCVCVCVCLRRHRSLVQPLFYQPSLIYWITERGLGEDCC